MIEKNRLGNDKNYPYGKSERIGKSNTSRCSDLADHSDFSSASEGPRSSPYQGHGPGTGYRTA